MPETPEALGVKERCRHCKRPMRTYPRRPDVHYCPHCDRMPEER